MRTKIIKVNPDFPEKALIKEAAEVLRNGGLVAFPTETVYGIGVNLLDQRAIDRLYSIKKRPRSKLFTVHISRFEALDDLGIVLSERAKTIIHKFWPGPLTIVAFNKKGEKIGIRMPRNKIALALISEAALPIAAPSANISGGKPPTSGREVYSEMKDSIDILLDGGATQICKESTVLDVTTSPFTVLREGVISKEEIVSDYNVLFVCTGNSCRSVMAKATLEKFLKQAGLSKKVYVDSAGTV
ncbi:MAG: L-threonylcarbamoyladenylate synthase, partial [Candidatus Omnitrophota bacterium]